MTVFTSPGVLCERADVLTSKIYRITEFTEGHQYRGTDGIAGTGLIADVAVFRHISVLPVAERTIFGFDVP